jgi:hypothetical protein
MKKTTLIYIYASLLFILFFDLWVENSDQAKDFFGIWIQPFVDEPKFSVVWTILLIVGLIVIFKYYLDLKDEEIKELEKTLESEMAILVMANKELNRYRLQENLLYILNRFVQTNPYVSAVQWYQYSEKNLHGQTKIKLNFQLGSVVEEVNLNAVQQIYYSCNTSDLKSFRTAKKIYAEDGKTDNLIDFIIYAHNKIANKSEDQLSNDDIVLCSLMLLAMEIFERDFEIVIDDFLNYDTEIFQKIIANNRTGILRAAIMEDEYYSFTHIRENEKLNRQYIARLVRINNENIVFTIVLDASILDEEDYKTIMLKIATEFENLLKGLEKLYNKDEERAGE